MHPYSHISPVGKGQSAYLAKRRESRQLRRKRYGIRNRGGRLQYDKDPISAPTRQ